MKILLRNIHLWLSVPLGIIITLVCFSGAALVLEDEITRLSDPRLYRAGPSGRAPLTVDSVAATVARTLPEGVHVTGVTASDDPTEAYRVSLSKPKRAAIYVNQYTGEINGTAVRKPFFTAMFRLHRWLMDTGRPDGRPAWGKITVGVSTLLFVLALLSGVAVWWPRNGKALRNSLKLTLHKGRFRLWHSLHVAGGMYALIILLVMALTGLTWSFAWYRNAFYAAFGVKQEARGGSHGDSSGKARSGRGHGDKAGHGQKAAAGHDVWQKVYDKLRAENPSSHAITVGDGTASVSLGTTGNGRASDKYTFDRRSGRITSATPYAQSSPSDKLRGWIYAVHTGSFVGIITRILWFLAALLGAALPLTGYYLWFKRLSRKR